MIVELRSYLCYQYYTKFSDLRFYFYVLWQNTISSSSSVINFASECCQCDVKAHSVVFKLLKLCYMYTYIFCLVKESAGIL